MHFPERDTGRPTHIAVGNSAVAFVIRRRLSTDNHANDLLGRIYKCAPKHTITVTLRSCDNAAVPLTRGQPRTRMQENEAGWRGCKRHPVTLAQQTLSQDTAKRKVCTHCGMTKPRTRATKVAVGTCLPRERNELVNSAEKSRCSKSFENGVRLHAYFVLGVI